MSGSGGFYKYRCKYFYTYNCPNWVYCNGHACAMCLAEGRDSMETEATAPPNWQQQQRQAQQHVRRPNVASAYTEICVPQAIHGTLRYTVMEIIPTDEPGPGAYWVLRQKAMAAQALPYSTFTTSDTPRPVMTSVGVTGQVAY
ncbi:hypothetical protein VTH82DRAFT_8181 [Thermothelomyces myriococcoides]